MSKGFAIHNAITDHGGMVPSTQMKSSKWVIYLYVLGMDMFVLNVDVGLLLLKVMIM